MCDDILRGSPYGLDFSVMAKARVIVAPPCWSTSTIPAGLRDSHPRPPNTIPGRVGPVTPSPVISPHRTLSGPPGSLGWWTSRQRCKWKSRHFHPSRGLRAVRRPAQRGRPALDRISDPGELRDRCPADWRASTVTAQRTGRPLGIGGNPSVTGAVPGAILDVVTRGSHRGAAAVAVNRTGSRRPEGVGHVRLGESAPFHRT